MWERLFPCVLSWENERRKSLSGPLRSLWYSPGLRKEREILSEFLPGRKERGRVLSEKLTDPWCYHGAKYWRHFRDIGLKSSEMWPWPWPVADVCTKEAWLGVWVQGHSVVGNCERLVSDLSSCTDAGSWPLPAWIFIDCNSTLHKISLAFSLL